MPPKKTNEQQLQSLPPFRPLTVLPLFCLPPSDHTELVKFLNTKKLSIQKNLTIDKIQQILTEKGLYLPPKRDPKQPPKTDLPTSEELGVELIAKNFSALLAEAIVQARKEKKQRLQPKEPEAKKQVKKQTKKDGKKDSKAQQPAPSAAEQPPKVPEKVYKMEVDGILFILDFPKNKAELKALVESNQSMNIDLVLHIDEQVMWNWRQPDFHLLEKQSRTVQQMQQQMQSGDFKIQDKSQNNTAVQSQNIDEKEKQYLHEKAEMLEYLKQKRLISPASWASQTALLSLTYQKNPFKPHESLANFVDKMFTYLGEFSFDKKQYEEWSKQISKKRMVKPIQIVEKVLVEPVPEQKPKKDSKKDTKKDSKAEDKPPEYIDRVREVKYEDEPSNIRSDLNELSKVNLARNPKSVGDLVQNLVQVIKNIKKAQTDKSEQDEIVPISNAQKENSHYNVEKQYLSGIVLPSRLQFVKKQTPVTFKDIACLSTFDRQTLLRCHVLSLFQGLLAEKISYRTWDLLDRNYVERYDSHAEVEQAISKELERLPQTITVEYTNESFRLVVLFHESPPGRVLYHKSEQPCRCVPSIEGWIKSFKPNPENLYQKQFLEFPFEELGILGSQRKLMMSSDDAIISEVVDQVGLRKIQRHCILKERSSFGIKKNKFSEKELWVTIDGGVRLSMTRNISEDNKISKKIWIRLPEKDMLCYLDPSPTFISNKGEERKRKVGAKGEVTRHLAEGSIWIGYPNGDVSEYRDGKWNWIKNHKKRDSEGRQVELKFDKYMEGDQQVRCREDKTLFIKDGAVETVVFVDNTRIVTDHANHTKTISRPGCKELPTVRIRLQPHKQTDENRISYGSASAYLGFEDLFERSCDGYLIQVFGEYFNSYTYYEKVQKEVSEAGKITKKTEEDEVTLIYFREGSVLKACANGSSIYIASEDLKRLDSENEQESWLQLFTTPQNRKQGVYSIDMQQGSIETTDLEGNNFMIGLDRLSRAKIAVSLKINDDSWSESREAEAFGNGYHVVKENYFLPTPQNYIDPLLFVVFNNGTAFQLLNEKQMLPYINRSIEDGYEIHEETIQPQATHIQYTLKNPPSYTVPMQRMTKPLQETEDPNCLEKWPWTLSKKEQKKIESLKLRSLMKYQSVGEAEKEYLASIERFKEKKALLEKRQNESFRILGRDELLKS